MYLQELQQVPEFRQAIRQNTVLTAVHSQAQTSNPASVGQPMGRAVSGSGMGSSGELSSSRGSWLANLSASARQRWTELSTQFRREPVASATGGQQSNSSTVSSGARYASLLQEDDVLEPIVIDGEDRSGGSMSMTEARLPAYQPPELPSDLEGKTEDRSGTASSARAVTARPSGRQLPTGDAFSAHDDGDDLDAMLRAVPPLTVEAREVVALHDGEGDEETVLLVADEDDGAFLNSSRTTAII